MGKRFSIVVVFCLSFILLSASHSKASQERPGHPTPQDTYLGFRELVTAKRYDKAYALLDSNAKSEFKAAATLLLRMVMVPSGTLGNISDFELLALIGVL